MKIHISESRPGEFHESRSVLEARAKAAIQAALDTLSDSEPPLSKGQNTQTARGGEVDAIEELTKHMVGLYEKRAQQMLADLERVLESSVESR